VADVARPALITPHSATDPGHPVAPGTAVEPAFGAPPARRGGARSVTPTGGSGCEQSAESGTLERVPVAPVLLDDLCDALGPSDTLLGGNYVERGVAHVVWPAVDDL